MHRLGWPIVHATAATVLLVLSASGVFLSMFQLPAYLGLLWAVVGVGTLAIRRFRSRGAALLLLAGGLLSLSAPVAQAVYDSARQGAEERRTLLALQETTAPQLVPGYLFNGPAEAATMPEQGLVILSFWTIWCPPCLEEMPLLQRYAETHGDRVHLIGVTWLAGGGQETLSRIGEVLRERAVSYPVLVEDGTRNQEAYRVESLPTTVLIENRRVVAWEIGTDGTAAVLELAERRLDG